MLFIVGVERGVKMDNLKKVMKISFYNIKKWGINPRIYVILILLVCYIHFMEKPVKIFAENTNFNLSPYLFPFLISSGYSSKILLLLLIMLFCDAPFTECEYPYIVIRSGRKKWYLGQQLYICLASAIYMVLIIITSILVMLPNVSFELIWGKVINTFAQTGIAVQHGIVIPFDFYTVQKFSPIQAMVMQGLLCWLVFVMIGNVMFLINTITSRAFGALVATGIVFFQMFAENISIIWTYFSPTSWMSLSFLSIDGIGTHPSLVYALFMLVILNISLALISYKVVSRKDIDILKNI